MRLIHSYIMKMASYVKNEVPLLKYQDEVVVKHENDDSSEDWVNTPGHSYLQAADCKTELTHEVYIKEEPHEPMEDLETFESVHINNPKFQANNASSKKINNRNDKGLFLNCPYCKTKYFENNYKKHIECCDQKPNSLDEYSKEKTSSSIGHKQKQAGKKRFVCDVCNKLFPKNYHLVRHVRTHTGEKPFSCDECDEIFTRKDHLTSHKRKHTREQPFSCDLCNEKFSQKCNLTSHRRIHTGEKPFSCDFCNKQFAQKGHMSRHRMTHTGEKPFSCDLCNEKFTQKCNLILHRRSHTGEKPFSCGVCNKQFTRKTYLAKHKEIHTDVSPSHIT